MIVVGVPVVCRVTGLTRCGEVRRFVIRINRTIVIRQVTAHASRRQAVVLSARMALVAAGLNVLAR